MVRLRNETTSTLNKRNVAELQKILSDLGLPTDGIKHKLVERLLAAQPQGGTGDTPPEAKSKGTPAGMARTSILLVALLAFIAYRVTLGALLRQEVLGFSGRAPFVGPLVVQLNLLREPLLLVGSIAGPVQLGLGVACFGHTLFHLAIAVPLILINCVVRVVHSQQNRNRTKLPR